MELFDIKKIFKPLGNNPLLLKIQNVFFLQGAYLHAPLSFHLAAHPLPKIPKIWQTEGASFWRTSKPTTFGHGNDNDGYPGDAMG